MKKLVVILTLITMVLISCSDYGNEGMAPPPGEQGIGVDYGSYETSADEDASYEEGEKMSQKFAENSKVVTLAVTGSGTGEEQKLENSPDVPTVQSPVKQPDKIIKTGNMGMEVTDYAKSLDNIRGLVTKAQGYISSENEQRNDYRVTNTLVIRVGNDNFDMLMQSLSGEADKLTYKNVDLLDVTEEWTDLTSRLKTKKEVEQRYLDILKTAKTVKDVLAVEEELRQVREEIEVVEGRLKYLGDRVAYSTISLNLSQEFDYVEPTVNRAGFGTRMLNGLVGGWNALQGFVVGLAYMWPFLLIMGVFFYLIRRWWKKRKARQAYG